MLFFFKVNILRIMEDMFITWLEKGVIDMERELNPMTLNWNYSY